MEHWLVIITLASGEAFPIADFTSEVECYANLREWRFEAGSYGGCLAVDDSKIIVYTGEKHYFRKRAKQGQ